MVTAKLTAAVSVNSCVLLLNGCNALLTSLTVIVVPPLAVENSKLYTPAAAKVMVLVEVLRPCIPTLFTVTNAGNIKVWIVLATVT